jgi:hypothetical protein
MWAPDYPWGDREEDVLQWIAEVERSWSTPEHGSSIADHIAPSADEESKSGSPR